MPESATQQHPQIPVPYSGFGRRLTASMPSDTRTREKTIWMSA